MGEGREGLTGGTRSLITFAHEKGEPNRLDLLLIAEKVV